MSWHWPDQTGATQARNVAGRCNRQPNNERTSMRYQARWSNGAWKTFDRQLFADVDIHASQKMAEERAAIANATRRK